jgi:type IV pilus assembly protein PilQ
MTYKSRRKRIVMKTRPFFELTLCSAFVVLLGVAGLSAQALAPAQQEALAAADTAAMEDVTTQASLTPGNITVNFKDVDILTVFNYLSEVSGVDIIPTPGVTGRVTMRLRDKPWEVALDIVTRNYNYAYSREGNIIRVMPRNLMQTEDPVTEVVSLNNVVQEIELVKTEEKNDATVERKEQAIGQIMQAITAMLDSQHGERATFISGSNAVVITAIPAKINKIREMVAKVDLKPAQVYLEAKVIAVTLSDDEKLGIDWNAVVSASGARRPTTVPFDNSGMLNFLDSKWQRKFYPNGSTVDGRPDMPYIDMTQMFDPTAAPVSDALFVFGTLNFTQFTAVLRAIENRGNSEVLSTPRITTLNNQKATIKVVKKIMLQKTQEAIQTANVVTVEFEKESDAREVGVKLTAIPHVNEQDDIIVNLIPEVSNSPTFRELEISGAASTVAMEYDTRQANTQVRVHDGETIFIGGLIKDDIIATHNKLPILGDLMGDIPYLGKLVKYDAETVTKSEIVFFVTVHLVKDGKESIDKSATTAQYTKYVKEYNKTRESEVEDISRKMGEKGRTMKDNVLGLKTYSKDKADKPKPWFDFSEKGDADKTKRAGAAAAVKKK